MKVSDVTPPEETLGLEEAARMLRLGRDSMKELVDSGAVPATQLNQKHTVLLREDLIEYLRKEGRRQQIERQARKQRSAAPAAPRRPGRSRRPLPDLDKYEIGE